MADLQEILTKLNTIEDKIDQLNVRLEAVERSAGIMDEHVQWVNGVHNVIKAPLYSALNTVNNILHPLLGQTVDIEEIPNAPTYPPSLTYIVDEED